MSSYQAAREEEIFNKQLTILNACQVRSPLIFDVGANTGQSIDKYRELLPDCRIESFEPIPALAGDLEQRHTGDSHIRIHRLAIGKIRGAAAFHVTQRPEMSSLLKPEPWLADLSPDRKYDFSTIQVDCETLDALCDGHAIDHIDILKIDVQGAELDVLKGGAGRLSRGAIGMIYVEINLAETYVDQMTLGGLLGFLEPFGYQLWDILPFVFTGAGRAWTANALFVCSVWLKRTESLLRSKPE